MGKENFTLKNIPGPPCHVYKSGTSNWPQVFCHSEINLAIKEFLLLNIKIRENKPSGLFLSCLHMESSVTTDFPHRHSVYAEEWCWCSRHTATGRREEWWQRQQPFSISVCVFLLCWPRSRPCLPGAYSQSWWWITQGLNRKDPNCSSYRLSVTSPKGHRKHSPSSMLSICAACQSCWISNRLVSDTDLGRWRHATEVKSVWTLPSTTHTRTPGDETQAEPCVHWVPCQVNRNH